MAEKLVLEQYRNMKSTHADSLLMFQLGNFFIMLEKDAYVASKVLGLRVVSRDLGAGRVPACGIPASAVGKHAKTLAESGYAVAVCAQTEDEVGGIKNREVKEVLIPEADAPKVAPITEEDYAPFLAEFKALEAQRAQNGSVLGTVNQILQELGELNLEKITPTEAWAILYHWKKVYGCP